MTPKINCGEVIRAIGNNCPTISVEWFVGGLKFGREVTCNLLPMLIASPLEPQRMLPKLGDSQQFS